jgi:hypothetical protein
MDAFSLIAQLYSRFDHIPDIPDVVWAAIIAALIAWFTTFLSNRNSREQLRMQLHDGAEQRDRERAMALRRDVYLPTIEAIVRAQGALGRLLDLNADVSEISRQMVTDQATIAKVHLVASEATVRGVLEYQAALMPAYLEFSAERMVLSIRKSAIDAQQSLMDRSTATKHNLIELMREQNLSGNPDRAAMERINRQFEIETQAYNGFTTKHKELNIKHMSELLRVAEKLKDASVAVAALMPAPLLTARQELDLPIDADVFRRLYQAQQDAALRAIQEFIERVRTQLAQSLGPLTDSARGEGASS